MGDKTNHQRRRYAAEHKFARIAAIAGLIDAGGEYAKDGRKARKKLSESWHKRQSKNVQGFWKPANARAAA